VCVRPLTLALATICAACEVSAAPSASAAAGDRATSPYVLRALETLDGANSEAYAINDRGQVVGQAEAGRNAKRHAVLWESGATTRLRGLPGHRRSEATAINNAGDIVGASCPDAGECVAVLWRGDELVQLGSLGGNTVARGINATSQVVGESVLPVAKPLYVERFPHAFLWEQGVMLDLAGDFEDPSTVATAVNDAGRVVGYSHCGCRTTPGPRAFLWDYGVVVHLGTFGGSSARAFDVNERGDVVGEAEMLSRREGQVAASMRAFLWRDGRLTHLGTLGGDTSTARAINRSGQVVGWSTAADGTTRAFLWQDGAMRDLNDLIPPSSGWVLRQAYDMNASGGIVGTGEAGGQVRAYLLAPNR